MNNEPELVGSPLEDEPTKALLKKQRREEKRRQREEVVQKKQQYRQIKKILSWVIPLLLIIAGGWAIARSPKISDEDNPLISKRGIHWHADLAIWIKGERVTIPADIGLGGIHADTHTHKENDQIHLEISRPVRLSDTRLGKFFETWGKQFNSQCILEVCNGIEGTVLMTVNGEENTEFANYHMKDGDQIEIRYE